MHERFGPPRYMSPGHMRVPSDRFSLQREVAKAGGALYTYEPWGYADHLPRRNLLVSTATLATQTRTVTAGSHTLYIKGTGSVTISGVATGTLNGTGASDRVSLVFTATAGSLTLTVSGTVAEGHLTLTSTADHSYQAITDWTTEQYAWAAQKNVPWSRKNVIAPSSDLTGTGWQNTLSGAGVAPRVTANAGVNPITGALNASRVQLSLGGGTTSSDISLRRYSATLLGMTCHSVYARSYDGTSTYAAQLIAPDGSATAITITGTWQRFQVSATQSGVVSLGIRLRGGQSPTNSATADILVYGHQLEVGATATSLQDITTSWDAQFAALAFAAGVPLTMWQDSTGTTPVSGQDQPIGKIVDASGNGYHAIQSGATSLKPVLRLNANGGWYLQRDLVDDTLTATFPSPLATGTCVHYSADELLTLKDEGLTISGATSLSTPAADYGRVILPSPSAKDAKIIAALNAKRVTAARQLGPEKIGNVTLDVDAWWVKDTGWSISGGVASIASATAGASLRSATGLFSGGETFRVVLDVVSISGTATLYLGTSVLTTINAAGTFNYVGVVGGTSGRLLTLQAPSGGNITVDNISVREVLA